MPKKRIKLAQILSSRDGTLSKDAKLVNCMVEKDGENVNVVKRPGTYLFSQFPTGLGQGMFTINGVPYAIFNDVLYLGIAPFSGLAMPVGALPPPPAPAPLPQYAIFMGGWTSFGGPSPTTVTDKYSYTDNTVQAGAYLISLWGYGAACGNYTLGVLFDVPHQKYTYSGDVVSTGTVGTVHITGKFFASAVGNTTEIIFAGGSNDATPTVTGAVYKYQYSSDLVALMSVTILRLLMAATGTATIGIFGYGRSDTLKNETTKYTYASDTAAPSTLFSTAKDLIGAAGNTTVGVFCGGFIGLTTATNTTEKYTYSGDTITSGTSLSQVGSRSAAGNTTIGVFSGGVNASAIFNVTEVYTYATDAVTTGTALLSARQGVGAVSTSPGGF